MEVLGAEQLENWKQTKQSFWLFGEFNVPSSNEDWLR